MRAEAVPRRRISADEFERMGKAGIFHPEERVELLDGELYQMAALGTPHISCVIRLNYWFAPRLVGRAVVSVQNGIRLTRYSQPQPDIVLARYRDDFYASAPPGPDDILLIIEVADSSLRHDRTRKLPRYAAAGIAESWLVDLPRRRVTIYRQPSAGGYQQIVPLVRGGALSPMAFPDLQLRWEDIFGSTT